LHWQFYLVEVGQIVHFIC